MQTPSKLALSFVHTKIVQYGQKRMDFRYMIYGLDKIPQDQIQAHLVCPIHKYGHLSIFDSILMSGAV